MALGKPVHMACKGGPTAKQRIQLAVGLAAKSEMNVQLHILEDTGGKGRGTRLEKLNLIKNHSALRAQPKYCIAQNSSPTPLATYKSLC